MKVPEDGTLNHRSKYDEYQVESYNQSKGDLTGHECDVCKNKGYIMYIKDGYQTLKECDCMPLRRNQQIISKSGLAKLISDYTFNRFNAKEKWQQHIKESALRFIDDTHGNWFFIGGQVGAGKTHICTAIVNELMNKGNEALYMLWRDEIVKLKSFNNENYDYENQVYKLKTKKVLYIDDFFKSERGKMPTTADINIAFEILNYRYNNKDLITIFSSERTINELLEIDEAIGSRIYQMSKKYYIEVSQDKNKNMRMKGM